MRIFILAMTSLIVSCVGVPKKPSLGPEQCYVQWKNEKDKQSYLKSLGLKEEEIYEQNLKFPFENNPVFVIIDIENGYAIINNIPLKHNRELYMEYYYKFRQVLRNHIKGGDSFEYDVKHIYSSNDLKIPVVELQERLSDNYEKVDCRALLKVGKLNKDLY